MNQRAQQLRNQMYNNLEDQKTFARELLSDGGSEERVRGALHLIWCHYMRSTNNMQVPFDRYVGAYSVERVLQGHPKVVSSIRTLHPQNPSPHLPEGTTVWMD